MSSRVLTSLVYLAVALSLVATELVARRPRSSIPTIADVVHWASRRRSTQIGLLLAWWWLGWHFVLGA
jgi:hypothetical protein